MTQSNADVVYYQQVCVTPRRLHPVFPLIAPVLQEALGVSGEEEGQQERAAPVASIVSRTGDLSSFFSYMKRFMPELRDFYETSYDLSLIHI